MIKLIQDESGPLLRNLQDHALRFLNVESSDKHASLARADLDYKIATPHPFALFVQNDAILVQDAGLAIDYRARLRQLFEIASWAGYGLFAQQQWILAAAVLVARVSIMLAEIRCHAFLHRFAFRAVKEETMSHVWILVGVTEKSCVRTASLSILC